MWQAMLGYTVHFKLIRWVLMMLQINFQCVHTCGGTLVYDHCLSTVVASLFLQFQEYGVEYLGKILITVYIDEPPH